MSTAAASKRVPTGGYAKIPNSLIENQASLTHAELALALIICRREGTDNPVPVSDRNWQSWTGLSPRAKEYAAAGLKSKGLSIHGRGDQARFRFERGRWDDFVRKTDRSRARTEGRKKAVEPRKGSKVHQDCRDRGCALLASDPEFATSNAQPVAQDCSRPAFGPEVKGELAARGRSVLTLLPTAPVAQPVAQRIADGAEQVWAQTLAALQACFPLVGVVFLIRLVALVRSMFAGVTDTELAQAVQVAHRAKFRVQKSEGLFLLTVPDALRLARSRAPRDGPIEQSPHGNIAAGVAGLVGRVAEGLRARGAPFLGLAAELDTLQAEIPGADLEAIERQMQIAESAILTTAAGVLTPGERATVAACVESVIKPYVSKMSTPQLEQLRRQISDRETMTVLGVPRLGLFYV